MESILAATAGATATNTGEQLSKLVSLGNKLARASEHGQPASILSECRIATFQPMASPTGPADVSTQCPSAKLRSAVPAAPGVTNQPVEQPFHATVGSGSIVVTYQPMGTANAAAASGSYATAEQPVWNLLAAAAAAAAITAFSLHTIAIRSISAAHLWAAD